MANTSPPVHGPERLRVYQLALTLGEQIDQVLRRSRCAMSLASQLRRTTDSVVLNIAEGCAHFSPGRKLYHYQTAHGAATECVAALARMRTRNPTVDLNTPRATAELVSAMLVSLIHTQQARRQTSPARAPHPNDPAPPQ
jgi:four helix bundle protein